MAVSKEGGSVVRRIEASDSNVLSLIARLSVSAKMPDEANGLIARLKDSSLDRIAKAIIAGEGDKDPIAASYLRWAKDIQRGSNGSMAKRRDLLAQ